MAGRTRPPTRRGTVRRLPTHPALLAAALILSGLIFASLGLITGIWADTFDHHAFVANLITRWRFWAASSTPPTGSPRPWSTLTGIDPLYYLVDAARSGSIDHATTPVTLAQLTATGAAVGCYLISAGLLTSGWRLKP